ncbi:MAG TPA: hypothetical protein VKB95_11260 [Chitinophagaceae bacterium]|nr:hypothetical protein [Chitinophagaceae bacterium]
MINCEQARKVAVVVYNRIPFARINTAYINASNQDMLVATLNGLIEKYHLQNEILGEVAVRLKQLLVKPFTCDLIELILLIKING